MTHFLQSIDWRLLNNCVFLDLVLVALAYLLYRKARSYRK